MSPRTPWHWLTRATTRSPFLRVSVALPEPTPNAKSAPSRKTDRDEDDLRREVFIDQSALQGAATMGDAPVREYFYSGQKHRMLPLDPEAIVGDKEIKFNHGDLKFLSLLLRGHEVELHGLKFDKRCWTDVGKLLDRFNYCRQRCWGIRQLLRATKADNKGSIGLLGIDVPMKETIGPPLFPVRMRVSQGHNDHIVEDEDTDLFL